MKYSEILTTYTDILRCPVCGGIMSSSENQKSLICEKNHCFDIASRGYVNLALGHFGGGDSKEAVHSRTVFLDRGFYRPFAEKLCELIEKYDIKTLVDAGCGEGYYTDLIARSTGVRTMGFDLSKWAVDSAASRSSRNGSFNAAYGVGSIFELPLADECADGVINLFAPCAEAEFCRVMRRGGILMVAGAGEDHLFGLKKAIYEVPYKNEVRADLPTRMKKLETVKLSFEITLETVEDKLSLFSMTPYYYRTSKEDADKLLSPDPITTEVEFNIDIYMKEE